MVSVVYQYKLSLQAMNTTPSNCWISSTLLLLGASVIFMAVSVGLGHAPPTPASNSMAEGVPEDIVAEQPLLRLPPGDLEKNAVIPKVLYCLSSNRDATYYTYVYVWSFSDSPVVGRVLGYPSHRWDYEPIIVRIDKASLNRTVDRQR